MPCPSRAHAVPLPCRAAKGLECVFPIYLHSAAVSCHAAPMPCSYHAVFLKATAQHGRRETACGLPARVRLLLATTQSSTKTVIRSIQILLTMIHTYDCKEWQQHTTKKKRRCVKLLRLAVRIFPASTRTFTKNTALSERGRGAACHVSINARHGRGMGMTYYL
jgi:hypothetical protein